jgi:DNA-binding HxlR family transcriptional regulator
VGALPNATVVGHTADVAITDDTWIDNATCSVFRSLDLMGDRWSILVLREAFWGTRRFEAFQRHLGIARNILTDRLNKLVEAGILERRQYSDRPPRHEYRLTPAGLELWPILITLMQWGDKHLPEPDGARPTISHRGCGHAEGFTLSCNHCGEQVGPRDVTARMA